MGRNSKPSGWENTSSRATFHHDVLIRLNNGCESFRGVLETQLCGMREVHGQLAQGMQQFAHAVDTKLVQNDQRNDTQEGMFNELCTSMQNFGEQIGKNHQENILMYKKSQRRNNKWEVLVRLFKGKQEKVLAQLSKASGRLCMRERRSANSFKRT